jgi:UDP-glucose 4-epimerase
MRVKDARQNFLGIWVRLALEGKPFEVWGGTQRRDFSYVEDTADAMLAAAVADATDGLALNVAGDRVVTLGDLAELMVRANGAGRFETREFPAERKRIDIGDYYGDDALFRSLTGWAPRTGLTEGLAATLDYFRTHLPRYL